MKCNTIWYDENDNIICEENFTYNRYFKPGQSVLIDSKHYAVIRHNVCTNGDMIIFIRREMSKEEALFENEKSIIGRDLAL